MLNYASRRICALQGSSVDIISQYSHPDNKQTTFRSWYRIKSGEQESVVQLTEEAGRVQYHDNINEHILKIENLKREDSGEYMFPTQRILNRGRKLSDFPKVMLVVTDLQVKVIPSTEGQTVTLMCSTSCPLTEKPAAYIWYKNGEFVYEDWSPWYQELLSSDQAVRYSCAVKGYEGLRAPEVSVVTMSPSAEVTEGQRVTLTCSTSCPLTDNNNYIWYLNSRPLSQNKHLVLDPVGLQHAGNYSCAVKTHGDMESAVKTLTVRSISTNWKVAAMGVGAALVYSEISAQPAEEKHYYIYLAFKIHVLFQGYIVGILWLITS
uniref:Ig-like domain-containing protein n=1 Tax=Amphiprion percula TaxID=161767 RepID=A0A3P8SM45_AMPPE